MYVQINLKYLFLLAHQTIRLPCKALPWNCRGVQPSAGAPCIFPGEWFVIDSLVVNPQRPLVVLSNITVQGNLTVPAGAAVVVQLGTLVTVQGCLSISGTISIDVSTNPSVMTGDTAQLFQFGSNSSCANSSAVGSIVVSGAPACKSVSATEKLSSKGLSVLFEVNGIPNCEPVVAALQAANIGAIAGGIAAGVVLLLIIAFVIMFRFRRKIVPSLRLEVQLRKMSRKSSA
jgi:hypothetical protein